MKPIVAIVGRPNVGKSTLINRLVGSREAIVHDMPGVTRDRLYLEADWSGREFVVIDTGGIVPGEEEGLLKSVTDQAKVAVDEADVVLFVVDGRTGENPADFEIARELRQSRKPVLLVVNKLDNPDLDWKTAEFWELGLGEPHPISAIHGNGVGDLLDEVIKQFPPPVAGQVDEGLKMAIVGRPNVGKSSLVNALLGTERMIVADMAGTTRDAIDSRVTYHGKVYTLIDTAGIRRKARVDYGVEQFSVVRAIRAMERADVVLLVIDATQGVGEQDQRIGGMADDMGKAVVVLVNKWDLVPDKDSHTMKAHTDELRRQLYHLNYAPVIYTSAVTRRRLINVFEVAEAAAQENERRIPTGPLNDLVLEAISLNPPPTDKGKRVRVYYATQASTKPPTFVLFCNNPSLMPDSYLRYLEGKLREAFGFTGTPIRFVLRGKEDK